MKVKCVRNISATTGEEMKSDYWLTLGKVYTVLSVYAPPESRISFRLLPDDGQTPALFDSRQFETVCNKIPSNWVAVVGKQGVFQLGPEKWTRLGFWEDYFDHRAEAIKDFEEEKTIIMAEAGSTGSARGEDRL